MLDSCVKWVGGLVGVRVRRVVSAELIGPGLISWVTERHEPHGAVGCTIGTVSF